jgi:hypothetical protein
LVQRDDRVELSGGELVAAEVLRAEEVLGRSLIPDVREPVAVPSASSLEAANSVQSLPLVRYLRPHSDERKETFELTSFSAFCSDGVIVNPPSILLPFPPPLPLLIGHNLLSL